ncbi:MAG: nicotinate-nucleotide adenylyltransferase [Candidatus Symbiothrix sp.]|jgi:nicotinate-nucleotide adenylyltransferase|nr:nicotinate-nucleotide adenylyltransferase [Candidatus Symbiothrix sp.]
MKIGIFPGSFNPVHVGHLAIANYLAEYEEYDQIWFLISPQNPLKKKGDLLDQEFRLELIEKSVKGYEKFYISTIEWNMPQPSYTINTLQKLRVTYPEDTFELIIGSDNWATFHRWKDYQLILKNFKILIYPRRGSDRIFINHPNVRLCKGAPKIEISSTFIREAIKTGKDVRFYMPLNTFEEVVSKDFFKPEPPAEEETETQAPQTEGETTL